MPEDSHSLILKLKSKDIKDGRIPLSVFMKTAQNIQKTIYSVGNARLKGEPAAQGRKPAVIEQQCELFLVKAEPGSLTAELALPEMDPDLLYDLPNFGEEVLSDFKEILHSVSTNNPKRFKSIVKKPKCQKQIIDNVISILPSEKDDYELFCSFDDPKILNRISKPAPGFIDKYVDIYSDNEPEAEHYGLEKLRATVLAQMDQQTGKLIKIQDIIDYERLIDLRPYRASTLVYGNKEFILQHEIICTIDTEEDYVVLEYPPLNIETYAKTREDAIEDFKEEFAMIWDTYGLEKEDSLTQDAIELKGKIRRLVKGVQIRGDFENLKN